MGKGNKTAIYNSRNYNGVLNADTGRLQQQSTIVEIITEY